MDSTLSIILCALYYFEWNYRLENDDDMVYATLIDRSKYPRLWLDNQADSKRDIIAESSENVLNRFSPLESKDWIERFEGEDIIEAVNNLCNYITNTYPEAGFAKWYNGGLIYDKSYYLWRDSVYLGQATWTKDSNIGDSFISSIIDKTGKLISEVYVADKWLQVL